MENDISKRRQVLAALAATGMASVTGGWLAPAPKLTLPPAVSAATRRTRRPNILLIVNDQMRHWQDLPAGLGLSAQDWLLEKGTGFTHYHANTTPCSPSRSNMYFGQHTQHTLMTANIGAPPTFPELKAGMPSLGHLLRAQGYRTAYKGKWHLSHLAADPGLVYGPYPNTRHALEGYGFSDYNADGDPHGATWTGLRYDGQIANQSAQWVSEQRGDEPWFLAVNFVNPHDVMYVSTGAKQEASRLDPDLLSPLARPPLEGLYAKHWDLPMPNSFYKGSLQDKPWAARSFATVCDWLYGHIAPDDEAAWRAYQSYYFNCIRDVDSHALTVLRSLRDSGQEGDTIIVYTADHGEMAGAHKLRQKGPFMYKENIRVPFIVQHPDVQGGSLRSCLGAHIDLVPKLLGFAGVEERMRRTLYPYLRGHDIGAALTGAPTLRDQEGVLFNYGVPLYMDPAFTRVAASQHKDMDRLTPLRVGQLPSLDNPALFRGIHDGRYKFARYFKPSDHHQPRDWETLVGRNELELYDTQADPDEITNLAAQPEKQRAVIEGLNTRLNALIASEVGEDKGQELPGPGFLYRR